jgi:alpha-beta hydrolase superfamily lysophospholipase
MGTSSALAGAATNTEGDLMATERLYVPERVGDWGTPQAAPGGTYGTDTLARPDGVSLFFRYWTQPEPQAPLLVLLHGLGAHTGWFIDMGNALAERGLAVYAVDHRGFGRSGGPRGHVRRGMTLVEDCQGFVAEVRRRQPEGPLFLLGHSMGAILAVYMAADDARTQRNQLAGLLLLNPWVRQTAQATPPLGTQLGIALRGPLGSRRVPQTNAGSDLALMTTNPEAVKMLEQDTYWVRGRSEGFLYQVGGLLRAGMLRRARQVRAPTLVMQTGDDRVLVQVASRQCYDALGSADKTWKVLPGLMHDAELERERSAVDGEIAGWVARHHA